MSAQAEIKILHAKAFAKIRPKSQSPTRAEYAEALELADLALELAARAQLGRATIEACKALQRCCYGPLERTYARAENHERNVYEKHASKAAATGSGRAARVYNNTDAGEHLLEALEAVRVGKHLDDHQAGEAKRLHRRIRWLDEVANQPILTSRSRV